MGKSTNQTGQQRLSESKKLGNTPAAINQIKKLLTDFPDFAPGWIELGLIYRRLGDRQSAFKTFEEASQKFIRNQDLKLELSAEQLHFNQLEDCRQTVQDLLKINPENVQGLMRLGEIERKESNREEALEHFNKALDLSPKTIWAHIHIAIELRYFGKFEEAEQQLKKALEYSPQHFNIIMELGELYQKRQQPEQALIYFKQAQNNYPNRIEPRLKIIEIFRILKQFESQENQLNKLLENFPNNFNVLMQFGHLGRQKEQREEAFKWFTLASQKAPNSSQAIHAKLFAIEELKELGKIDEAVETIKPILEQSPDNIRAKLIYGRLLKRQLNSNGAVELYREIINLDSKNIPAHLELATCLSELNQTQEAIDLLEGAKNLYPDDLRIFHKMGDLFRKQQDRKKALIYYKKALEIDPQHLWANLNVATELRELGNLEAAEKQIHQALEYHPNHFNALMQLGQLEQRRQKLDLALEYFQKVIDNYPDRIEPHLATIDILRDSGRLEQAQSHLNILRKTYPKDSRAFIHSGHFERRLGQREKALQWFHLAQEKAANPNQNLEAQILGIEELRDLGRFDQALKLIDLIIQQFPEHIRPQMVKGSILQKQANLREAAHIYQNILSTEPNHLQSQLELARIYSQSGQVETAIAILEETHKLFGSNFNVFTQLGSLNQALEEWETARQWYQKACQEYPYNFQGYCTLANLMFLKGEAESAIQLLNEAQVKIPDSVQIIIKLIELNTRLGNFELSHKILKDGLNRFPGNIQLLFQLCRLQMAEGDYSAALDVFDKISTDNQDWMRQTEQLKANIYFHQYNYKKAEEHFRKVISLAPTAVGERNQLATLLMLKGQIEQARNELKIATEELNLKTPPGKSAVPLKSHSAMVINELRINPLLLAKLQEVQQETGYEKIIALSGFLAQEPTYLGTALYLASELRQQGIFDGIQESLSQNATSFPSIPKRIVQFWDEPEPPEEVQRVCQSWIDLNPEYEYTRFSLETAVTFLKEHYDQKVLQAFANCDQPATQADLFRLAYLNKMGGFYADADDQCRQSLDTFVNLSPELVVPQEIFASIGNNFLGCIPGQSMIRIAFYQAVSNLIEYNNESPWFQTGPGLLTSVICSGLVPYLTYTDYEMWPRLLVLTLSQLKKIVNQHMPLAYKRTEKSWSYNAYQRGVKLGLVQGQAIDMVVPRMESQPIAQ